MGDKIEKVLASGEVLMQQSAAHLVAKVSPPTFGLMKQLPPVGSKTFFVMMTLSNMHDGSQNPEETMGSFWGVCCFRQKR